MVNTIMPSDKKGYISGISADLGTCGGYEAMKIASMAVRLTPEYRFMCASPIAIAASLHVEASLPNFVIHEHHVTNRSENNIRLGVYDYQPVAAVSAMCLNCRNRSGVISGPWTMHYKRRQ
ncbi:MAG: enolase C-terminal domain-like protein [Enterocloster bolteae]